MRRQLGSWAACAIVGAGLSLAPTSAQAAESCPADRSPIMILGTYHMANPGLDAVNLEADDVLSKRRQAEIAELVEKLARFRPSKVMLEAPASSALEQQRYRQYLAGKHQLTRNETEQIGFRLARRMALPAVHSVDFPMMMSGLTYDELEFKPTAAANAAKPAEVRQLSEGDLRLRRSTVAEFLLYMNDGGRALQDHVGYMSLFEPDPEDAAIYAKADRLTHWYKRNFRMFANVVRKTDRPRDRVLLLVGAGHLTILRDLAKMMPGFCLVEPHAYLK